MSGRHALFLELAEFLASRRSECVFRVAIDGVDGAGKTTFADELAEVLRARGRFVIRSSVDGFHQPKDLRYRRGRTSPEGFYLDSYDYDGLKAALLNPLSPSGSMRYRSAIFDHVTDSAVSESECEAPSNSVLLFDGIFLHRPELRAHWDFSIFLDVDFQISIPRGVQRASGSPDPLAESNRRYVQGQEMYLAQCRPRERANLVVDYNDLRAPRISRGDRFAL